MIPPLSAGKMLSQRSTPSGSDSNRNEGSGQLLGQPGSFGSKAKATLHTDNTAYSTTAQILWLLFWFFNNIGITLINKAAFATVDFRYPCLLSAVHMACNTMGAYALLVGTGQKQKEIDQKGQCIIVMFSLIFAANIVVGNASLRYVSVNFNQVLRSLVPALVLGINMIQGKRFSAAKILAVVPIVAGVAAATLGDLRYTYIGGFMTAFCVLLAAMKAIASGALLTGDYKLEPFDLLSRMAPLSLIWMIVLSVITGEFSAVHGRWGELSDGYAFPVVISSGILSVSLNIASFMANKVTSPLTLTVASNVKQVLLILISTMIFNTPVSLLNGCGIGIVLVGSARYSLVSVREKQLASRQHNAEHGASKA